jgi:hypothetical protein
MMERGPHRYKYSPTNGYVRVLLFAAWCGTVRDVHAHHVLCAEDIDHPLLEQVHAGDSGQIGAHGVDVADVETELDAVTISAERSYGAKLFDRATDDGGLSPTAGLQSVIGMARTTVAAATEETYQVLQDQDQTGHSMKEIIEVGSHPASNRLAVIGFPDPPTTLHQTRSWSRIMRIHILNDQMGDAQRHCGVHLVLESIHRLLPQFELPLGIAIHGELEKDTTLL